MELVVSYESVKPHKLAVVQSWAPNKIGPRFQNEELIVIVIPLQMSATFKVLFPL